MTVFGSQYYQRGGQVRDVPSYTVALLNTLNLCRSKNERDALLRKEAISITREVTEGIRDLVVNQKQIRHLVLDLGAVPLATWTDMLNMMAERSMPELESKVSEMKYELEHGKVEGFPGTMFLFGKPTFNDFEDFYTVVFSEWHSLQVEQPIDESDY